MKQNKRAAARKEIEGIEINDLTSISNYSLLARTGKIINASSSGFLVLIDRKSLVPEELRENLNLQSTVGQNVALYLPQMNLDMDGVVTRALHRGKGQFVIAIDFSYDVPEYWRDCLVELLPSPDEFEEISQSE